MLVHAKILGMLENDLNEMQRDIDQTPELAKSRLMRLLLLFVFVAGGAIFFALGLDRFLPSTLFAMVKTICITSSLGKVSLPLVFIF